MRNLFILILLVIASSCVQHTLQSGKAKNSFQSVVSYHPQASQIGEQILDEGGNAFDAFVATTAAQYVLSEGVTSIGGPLGALLYDAKSKSAFYMDAEFNDPLEVDEFSGKPGDAVLVPGAIAGLEAISKSYGKLPFKKVLEPAIGLARNGFTLNQMFANVLASPIYQAVLKRSEYGADTFYPKGIALKEGDWLKLPELAEFLERLADEGSSYAYTGEWAKKFVKKIVAQGGHLSLKDLANYKVIWWMPPHIHYRNLEIYSSGGRAFGGLNTLLSLKALEHEDLKKYGKHFSKSAEALELLIRIENEVKTQAWLKDFKKLDNAKFIEQALSQENADLIFKKVQAQIKAKASLPLKRSMGTHSYQVVVIDKEGNAITGTNTIESMPWAQGIFVDGVALTGARNLKYFSTRPGDRRLSGFSMEIGIKDEHIAFASGAFNSSLIPAAFEFIVNVVDYRLSAMEAMSLPRFGDEAWNFDPTKYESAGALWLDPRIDKEIVENLSKHNIKTIQSGIIDTGLGALAIVKENKEIDSSIAPILYNTDTAKKKEWIGVGLVLDTRNALCFVKQVLPNTEAFQSKKIHVGDELIAIQANSNEEWLAVAGLPISEILNRIRGPENTKIGLKFIRNSEEFSVILNRRKFSH